MSSVRETIKSSYNPGINIAIDEAMEANIRGGHI